MAPINDPPVVELVESLVVVFEGPRGMPGGQGDPGNDGNDGQSFDVMGDWSGLVQYEPGDAVTSRSLNSPGLTSLWIVKNGQTPTLGIAPHLEAFAWSEVSAGGDSSGGAIYRIVQNGHPFTMVGEPVARSEVTGFYQLADASVKDLLAIGVVAEIVDANQFAIQLSGRVIHTGGLLIFDPVPPAGRSHADWELGKIYYLSTRMGMYEVAEPTEPGAYFQPMVVPISLTEFVLLTWGPDNSTPPALVVSGEVEVTPVPGREGQLWYRRTGSPGLYIALYDITGTTLMWVQANG